MDQDMWESWQPNGGELNLVFKQVSYRSIPTWSNFYRKLESIKGNESNNATEPKEESAITIANSSTSKHWEFQYFKRDQSGS